MKRYLLYMLLILWNMSFFTACFDDKSTDPDHPIPDIVIDTTGIPVTFKVVQNERLVIQPKVSLDNGDDSDFSYKWMLNTIADNSLSSGARSNYICIGEHETLDTVMFLTPNETSYFLWYQVTDNKTQYRRDILWNVLVQSAYNEGILIVETKDGRNTDFSLIEGKQFTEGWTATDKISHNLYSSVNGSAMEGLVKQVCHSYNSSTQVKSKRFYCIGDDFYALVDGLEYELVGRNFEVIYDNSIPVKPDQIFYSGNNVVWVNDGNIYPFSAGLARDYPNIQIPMGYSVQEGETQVMKTSRVDKCVAFTHQSTASGTAWGVWYDKEEGRFLCQKSYPYVKNNIATFASDAQKPFDPNNLRGLETVYAATGVDDNFFMVMKNVTTGVYQIYVIERTTSSAKYLYDIPGNEMDNAVGYTVSEDGNVMYFATSTQVYSIVLGGVSPQVNLLYTIPSGEITHFSMFRQAWYLLNPRLYVSGVGYKTPIDTHEHLLLAGVWDGTNGTLYSIPIVSASGGTIDVNNIKTYPGFGKILTIVSQQ